MSSPLLFAIPCWNFVRCAVALKSTAFDHTTATTEKNSVIQTRLSRFQQLGLDPTKISFIEQESAPKSFFKVCSTIGSITNTNATITIDRDVQKKYPDGFYYLMKHQLSHILHGDALQVSTFSLVATFATAFITHSLPTPTYIKFGLVGLSHLVTEVITRYHQEVKADEFATQHSAGLERTDVIKHYRDRLTINRDLRLKGDWLVKLWYNQAGDVRFDITQPSLSSRIAKLEAMPAVSA